MCYIEFIKSGDLLKTNKVPIIITTQEALYTALDESPSVIYIDMELYTPLRNEIKPLLAQHGYARAPQGGMNGVFYLKCSGTNRFDLELHEIYDPFNIL